jgi:hypothetical protein
MSKFEEKYMKIGFGILDNNIFLLRINNKWYRLKKQIEKIKILYSLKFL